MKLKFIYILLLSKRSFNWTKCPRNVGWALFLFDDQNKFLAKIGTERGDDDDDDGGGVCVCASSRNKSSSGDKKATWFSLIFLSRSWTALLAPPLTESSTSAAPFALRLQVQSCRLLAATSRHHRHRRRSFVSFHYRQPILALWFRRLVLIAGLP